ncbi:MAG: O-antigen ligase family protein [Ruminococcaceae bacterium]|nr:O-antigen ligase family protein [Oscillospiraceae bacterium]
MEMTNRSGRATGLCVFFCLAPFLLALFHEWLSAAAALVLVSFIAASVSRGDKLTIPFQPLTAAVFLLPLAFAVSSFWAVDRGLAWFGVLKFLPLPLFALLLSQVPGSTRKTMLRTIPCTAAVMTVVSGALSLIPPLSPFFLVNGRLAGFFQYPNAYAAYAAVGVTLILTREEARLFDCVPLLVLLAGIAWSGSRAVMLLLALAMLICAVFAPNVKRRRECLTVLLLCAIAAGLFLLGRNGWELSAAARSLTHRSSTVYGRLLYDRDALMMILKRPFGYGYLGYAFEQGRVQTGVYSVTHVHNDFLQILLDVGWLPFAVCIWAVIAGLRRADRGGRIAASVLLAHSFVDFDLQFIALDFVLILLLMPEDGERKKRADAKPPNRAAVLCGACLIGAFSLWLGASSFLHHIGREEAAFRIYPQNTLAAMNLMRDAEGLEERAAYAEKILTWNPSCAQACRVMARSAFAGGDIEAMSRWAGEGIACAKYDLDGYLDYFDMLSYALSLYRQAGDKVSESWCLDRLAAISERLREVKETTSPLAWKIADQPKLDLPEEYELRLNEYGIK